MTRNRISPRNPAALVILPALLLALTGCRTPGLDGGVPSPRQNPEEQHAERHMVSTANPLATEIGRDVLRRGGNAVDAAVAVQMALTFVEPPESGLGGGSFMLLHKADGETMVYDGREVAPAAAEADRFLLLGLRLPLWAAIPSGRAVGVPGTLAMLYEAHQDHGSLPWAELLEPAIALAEEGIPMPTRLQEQVSRDRSLRLYRDTRRYFVHQWRQNEPRLHNPELADTLRLLAAEGPTPFYRGELAEAMVTAARGRWPGRSDLTLDDFRNYRAKVREPVCGTYRQWTLCGPPPPSSGGIAVLQILGMLERFDLGSLQPNSPEAVHLITEASRLAFADRFHYVGDPTFVEVPTAALVDPLYLADRAQLIDPAAAMERPFPGEPGVRREIEEAPEPVDEETVEDTSHVSIVDGGGNSVSMTSSIEAPFGSRIMVGGFLLNNQLTDFTFRPRQDGLTVPNAVAGGKRPRSSMSPFIVLDENDRLRLVIGSRGGSRIIGYVVKALVGVLDWDLSVQEAVSLPNFAHRGEGLELERGTELENLAASLRDLGHGVRVVPMRSGIHGVERIGSGWRGGADPRLDGIAIGD